ncbi:MAG: ECF transporter S component [Thermomicrobiales bacterium]
MPLIALLGVSTFAALAAFALPFVAAGAANPSRVPEGSLVLGALTAGGLALALVSLGEQAGPRNLARATALLGVLVALDASLRLAPAFLGASPIFVLIVLVGYVFGPAFGFTMGALTLLLSALLTAGIGPWLPFQMACAAWVGAGAGLLPHPANEKRRTWLLAGYGVFIGLAYGALMNLYSWPFAAPGVELQDSLYWAPGLGLAETAHRYATFYLTTSLWHDLTRSVATAALLIFASSGVISLLQRFQLRAAWHETDPAPPVLAAPEDATR